jgi:hypothetical protein
MNNEAERQPAIITRIAAVHIPAGRIASWTPRGYEPEKDGSSTEVPSGSTRKIGFEPADGAGGPSSEKHTIWGSPRRGAARAEETRVTPTPFLVITIARVPSRRSAMIDSETLASPALSSYQRTDLSMSDTNTTTFGVVGAAVVHGPNSAWASLAGAHATRVATRNDVGQQRAHSERSAVHVRNSVSMALPVNLTVAASDAPTSEVRLRLDISPAATMLCCLTRAFPISDLVPTDAFRHDES